MRRNITLVLLTVFVLGFGAFFRLGWYAITPLHRYSNETVILEVQKGMGPRDITQKLEELKIVDDKDQFLWLGRVLRRWGKIKAGEYQLTASMTPIEVFGRITSGVSMAYPITVREGENMYEIADTFDERGLMPRAQALRLFKSREIMRSVGFSDPLPLSLEGYLYPETYHFSKTQTPEEMVKQMVKLALSHWTPELQASAQKYGMSRQEVFTLASIIEKETGAPNDRPLISAVFHNRLKKKMRLQTDPTVIYGIWERFDGNIHKSTLSVKTPYNTYVIPALPIGPISNPGVASLRAALHPAESPYLYFVSRNDGTTVFSATLVEHNRAVAQFQLDPKARAGKSWRDLKKRGASSSN